MSHFISSTQADEAKDNQWPREASPPPSSSSSVCYLRGCTFWTFDATRNDGAFFSLFTRDLFPKRPNPKPYNHDALWVLVGQNAYLILSTLYYLLCGLLRFYADDSRRGVVPNAAHAFPTPSGVDFDDERFRRVVSTSPKSLVFVLGKL